MPLHPVEMVGEGLGIRVVGVEPDEFVVELPGPGRTVRFVEFGHLEQGSG
ncbi:hypothetical protein GCM10009609_54610 [Pseudonocardia aurantiaca]